MCLRYEYLRCAQISSSLIRVFEKYLHRHLCRRLCRTHPLTSSVSSSASAPAFPILTRLLRFLMYVYICELILKRTRRYMNRPCFAVHMKVRSTQAAALRNSFLVVTLCVCCQDQESARAWPWCMLSHNMDAYFVTTSLLSMWKPVNPGNSY